MHTPVRDGRGKNNRARDAGDEQEHELRARVHAQHFVDCLRTRKTPRATAAIGHRSNVVPLLGNIAYKTKLKLRWDAEKENFIGAPKEASLLLGRKARKPWDRVTI